MPSLAGGGAEKAMMNLVTEFANQGIAIDLLVIEPVGPYSQTLSHKIKLYDLSASSFVCRQLSKLKLPQYVKALFVIPALIKYLKRERVQVLITTLHLSNMIGLMIKKYFVRRVKLIVRMAGAFSMELSTHVNGRKIRLLTNMVKCLLPASDAIVANSKDLAIDIKTCVPALAHKVHTVYNPIVIASIREQAAAALSHPWLDHGSYRVILSVGRLHKKKDFPTLLRAFAQIRASMPASRLVILGEGQERHALEKLAAQLAIKDFIDFAGFKANPFCWMAKSHVLVSSSLVEGFPNVLVESMACGTPVVSTDCPTGPREILHAGRWGKLVPVGDCQRLATAVLETLQNPTPSERLRERAQDFSLAVSLAGYKTLFLDIVHENK